MQGFDDVTVRMLEEPGPAPRESRRRRLALGAVAVTVAGGLAVGAFALTGSGERGGRTVPVGAPIRGVGYNADGVPAARSHPECCLAYDGRRNGPTSAPPD